MLALTDEELAYFSNTLSLDDDTTDNSSLVHSLSVETEIPQVLAHILGSSKLTLLAEVSYYRLFFPLTLKVDSLGLFTPTLGTPEVIDMRGGQRSWRLEQVKDVKVIDNGMEKNVEVLSLSSSGMSIKLPQEVDTEVTHVSQIILPNGSHLDVAYEPVRTENGVMAAKISAEGSSREMLREFLFNEHKAKYEHLYKRLNEQVPE
jgi:hypothetical protein